MAPGDPTIRPVRADELAALVTELWRPFAEEMAAMDAYNTLATDIHEDCLEDREERFADADCETLLAVAGDRDGGDGRADGPAVGPDGWLGYVALERAASPPVFARGPTCSIEELYVRPAARGDGIATALLDRAHEWGRERGCERAELSVNAANEGARGLYEAVGYSVRRLTLDRPLPEG